MAKYYEALDRNHKIARFEADSDDHALIIAKSLKYLCVIRIKYKSLKILYTVLPYKCEGH